MTGLAVLVLIGVAVNVGCVVYVETVTARVRRLSASTEKTP